MILFSDNDSFNMAWLTRLFPAAAIDSRCISRLDSRLLSRFSRVHLFAGIGGWEYALNLGGWPLERPVWSGSCPCQPFSVAGKRGAFSDTRHLWPIMYSLIKQCRPPTIFGEQVASLGGFRWFSRVRADLESISYAVGAANLPAACVGAPHRRERIFWVADSLCEGPQRPRKQYQLGTNSGGESIAGSSRFDAWRDFDTISFPDDSRRRIKSGVCPMANGFPSRVGRLRGYGNAIVPQVGALFVQAYMSARGIG